MPSPSSPRRNHPLRSAISSPTSSALTPARQQSLETWHRNFLRTASSSLGDLLRLDFDLELASVQIQTYGDMVEERGRGKSLRGSFRMNPQPGIWLLDLPVSLSLQLVDRMIGGSGILPEGGRRQHRPGIDRTRPDDSSSSSRKRFLADYARRPGNPTPTSTRKSCVRCAISTTSSSISPTP